MKTTTAIKKLVEALNQQTLVAEAARAEVERLRSQLLGVLLDEGATNVETPYGKAQVIETRSYDFSGIQEIEVTKNLLDQLRKRAQEEAPFTTSHSIRFFPNRSYEAPKITKTSTWTSKVLVKNGKKLLKEAVAK